MRLSIVHRLILLALALSLGIGTLFAQAIWSMRSETWDYAERTNVNLAYALEQAIRSTLASFDQSLLGVVEGLSDPRVMALPAEVRNRALFDKSLRVAGVGSVLVLDASGDVVHDSQSAVPRQGHFAFRDYFRAFKDGSHQGLYIGAPILARLNGVRSLPLARAYHHPDGRFAGVVVGVVQLDYFQGLFDSVNQGTDSNLNLFRTDGTLIARLPSVEEFIGRNIGNTSIWLQLSAAPRGTFTSRAAFDGMERLYAFQQVEGFALVVSVGQSVDEILLLWRRNAALLGSFAGLLMLSCIGLVVLFARELAGRQQVARQLQETEHYLRTILDNLPSTISYWDRAQRNRFINKSSQELYGRAPEEVQGMSAAELLGPNDYAVIEPYLKRVLRGHPQLFERTLTDASGEVRHTHISYTPDQDEATGEVRGMFVQMTDITERKRIEDELFREKERMRLTLQSIGDAVICTDAQGRITYLNPVAQRMTGWQAFDAAGQNVDEVAPLYLSNGAQCRPSPMRQTLEKQSPFGPTRGVVLRRTDGQRFEVEESASPIIDRHRHLTGAVMVLHDVTEAMAMAERMAHLAQYDPLTDLPNRALLQDRARHALALARRDGKSLAVMYLDLDGFKQVNDTLGHDVGDELLVQFARRLAAAMRESDTVCRQGGDEFVVLLPGLVSEHQACVVGHKLLAVCHEPFVLQGQTLRIGLSAGMALFPQHGSSFDELARNADAAMYSAKRAGRMQVHRYAGPGVEPELVAPLPSLACPADSAA